MEAKNLIDGIKETIKWMFEKDIRRRFNKDLDDILEMLTNKYNNEVINGNRFI